MPKSGPFHDPQFGIALQKLALQTTNPQQSDKKNGQPQGRPKNAKDKQKRKQRRFTPVTKAVVEIWARGTQLAIAETLNSLILEQYGKRNMRSLTKQEAQVAEELKFGVLCNLEPLGVVDDTTIVKALSKTIPQDIYKTYLTWTTSISKDINRTLTLDELKHVQVSVYTSYTGE